MAEELQNLLERIQRDGVEKANTEAGDILESARKEAAAIKAEAEREADARLKKAETDSEALVQRGRKSLEQAARDTILTIGESLQTLLQNIVSKSVSESLDEKTLQDMLTSVVASYCEGGESRIEILLNPEQQETLRQFVMGRFAAEMENGLEVKSDKGVVSGFRVSVVDRHVRHDFTEAAMSDAVCRLVRPHLAAIVRESLPQQDKQG